MAGAPKKGKKPSKLPETTAMHVTAEDGTTHVVGIGNLRVTIVPDGDFWFAQGLEVDYAAQGSSPEDARKQFEDGLMATVQEHLKIYGTIEKLLEVAPTEVWKNLMLNTSAIHSRFSQVSVHQVIRDVLPFQAIEYLELRL